MTKPIFSLPRDERYLVARRRRGELVVVELDANRDGDVRDYPGELVSVAFATPSDVVVVRDEAGNDRAFSLAQVRALRPWHPEEARS